VCVCMCAELSRHYTGNHLVCVCVCVCVCMCAELSRHYTGNHLLSLASFFGFENGSVNDTYIGLARTVYIRIYAPYIW
jgi:hypothetical protein